VTEFDWEWLADEQVLFLLMPVWMPVLVLIAVALRGGIR
jgi:hypothetical protein